MTTLLAALAAPAGLSQCASLMTLAGFTRRASRVGVIQHTSIDDDVPRDIIGLGPDAEQGHEYIERTRELRPAFYIEVTPTAAEGIVAVAALRSRSSRKQR